MGEGVSGGGGEWGRKIMLAIFGKDASWGCIREEPVCVWCACLCVCVWCVCVCG